MLSVLLVNWNTRDLLRSCVASLLAHPPSGEMEILIVDNASTDGSAEMVQAEFPNVKLIQPGRNTGYAAGNNLAFAEAQGEWLLTLNPDTEVGEGVLEQAVQLLESRTAYGVLSCRFIGPDGETQASVRGFPTLKSLFGELTGLARLAPRSFGNYRLSHFDYSVEQPAPQPMGTFLLFRREALAAVGDPAEPFDERFPIFFNEVDLLLRLNLAGWPCLYTPKFSIRHHGGMSTRQVRKEMIWESHRSLVRFLEKHATRRERKWLGVVKMLALGGAFVRAKGYREGFRP